MKAIEVKELSKTFKVKQKEKGLKGSIKAIFKPKYKDKKALFMGDMELEGEELLVKKYNMDADMLKVGHHGSITSTTEELANEVTPDISVISMGDRFESLPSKEVLNRLNKSDIYITKENGGIKVSIDKNGNIEVKTAK